MTELDDKIRADNAEEQREAEIQQLEILKEQHAAVVEDLDKSIAALKDAAPKPEPKKPEPKAEVKHAPRKHKRVDSETKDE